MEVSLLNNLPVENLNLDNDYLGIIEKGKLIKLFLEKNKSQFSEIKMFALYGEWGSGKSTLMKYLQKELKATFNTFFFDTWEFETDDNLPLSLLELMVSISDSAEEKMAKEFVEVAEKLLKGFTKSVRISIPALGSIDGKNLVEELEKEKEKTFFELKEEFKVEFRRFEDKLKAQNNKEYNIVFIDDLDRCEPENVLNLLSALKLFFTYGQRTIFFCGIDKKAVNEAVKTKYGEVVKANELLEKVFDITFEMPECDDIQLLVNQLFDETPINLGSFKGRLNAKIADFFLRIRFTNPRRVKKVLNKYLMLASFKQMGDPKSLIPNIFYEIGQQPNFLETILTIYFLILNEFHKDKLNVFNNIDLKKINYKKAVEAKYKNSDATTIRNNIDLIYRFFHGMNSETTLRRFSQVNLGNQQQREGASKSFIAIFAPHNPDNVQEVAFLDLDNYRRQFQVSNKQVDYYFTEYLIDNIYEFLFSNESISEYPISNFKKMLRAYL